MERSQETVKEYRRRDDGKEEGKGRESLLFSLLLISPARAHLLGAPSFILKQLSLNF